MSKSIRQDSLRALLNVYPHKGEDYGCKIVRNVTVMKTEPKLTLPFKNFFTAMTKYDTCWSYGIITGLTKLTVLPDLSVADVILAENTSLIGAKERDVALNISYLVYIQPARHDAKIFTGHETDYVENIFIYPLSEALIKGIRNGSITQTIFHKTGKVITE